jgi:phosphohistidine phosphatase SixA
MGEPALPKLIAFLLVALMAASPAIADDAAWDLLTAGGKSVLIRHARAPGVGDPPNFAIEDCATQRNLSDDGRAQARRLGALFAERGVRVDRVLSSRWCRSLETARLAFGAERTEPFEPLDSFFAERSREAGQSAAVTNAIAAFRGPGVLVMVAHQVNITALTGIVPRQGEALVVTAGPNGPQVAGRIAFD